MIRRPPRSTRTDTLFPYTTLFRSELRLHGASLTERGRQVRQPLHHLSKMPVCKAAMLAPCNPIQIEEEAWLWLTNEFVDLAADVAQIDVRAIGVAHVNRMADRSDERRVGKDCVS